MKDWWSPSRSGTPGSRFASLAPEALLQSRKGGTKHSHHQTSCQNVFQVFSVGKNVSWCSRARCLLEEASKTGNSLKSSKTWNLKHGLYNISYMLEKWSLKSVVGELVRAHTGPADKIGKKRDHVD